MPETKKSNPAHERKVLRQPERAAYHFSESGLTGDFIASPNGRILACNPTYARMLGFPTRDDAIGSNFFELISDARRRESLMHLLQKRGRIENLETELRAKDGHLVYVIGNLISQNHVADQIGDVSGFLLDITDRKKLEEQLRQSQKMEAIGQLAGGVAHDFNNLLTGILGFGQLLQAKLKDNPALLKDVEMILELGERATDLTRQLLAFSRRQQLEPRAVNLNELIEKALKMLQRFIGENIKLTTRCAENIGTVLADPVQIHQVLMNLTVNARDAMPNGGRIAIETQNVVLDHSYVHSHAVSRPGPYVMISFSDTGCGMDADTLSHIFEPFFTTKETGKGTGLGLSTAYGIVRQSGGYIWAYSEVGKGTTFKIYLPEAQPSARQDTQVIEEQLAPRGTETILIVENEASILDLAQRMLETQGYKILAAHDTDEAAQIFKQNGEAAHLLLADVILPGCNAPALYDDLAAAQPKLKVLYMSGYTNFDIVERGILDELDPFVQKPFTMGALAWKIRETLDK